MKKVLNFIVYIFAFFAISSCDSINDKEGSKDHQDKATTVEGISQEIKNKIAAQDTLMNALVLKVDTLAQALTQVQNENAELKSQVEKLESPQSIWGYLTLASIVLAFVALALSLLRKGVSREKVDAIFSHNLEKSRRIVELRVAVSQLQSAQNNNKVSQSVNSSLQNLDVRLRTIESALSRISSKSNEVYSTHSSSNFPRQEQNRQPSAPDYIKMGYANINTGKYFTKILDSNQETCVFSIKFKNERKGEFTIISLDKIKSRNGWQEVVEYTGSIEDATSFKEIEKGICEKYDENTWEVTKPLRIRLLK